jgi:hypothetical protein
VTGCKLLLQFSDEPFLEEEEKEEDQEEELKEEETHERAKWKRGNAHALQRLPAQHWHRDSHVLASNFPAAAE